MKKIYELLYGRLPKKIKNRLGSNAFLKPIREALLRDNGKFKEQYVDVERNYLGFNTKFRYYASIKNAIKAKKSGIENTILKNSILLLKQLNKLNGDCVIIDVGSNFGYMSMVWASSVCKKGTVYAFEANKDVYASFLKSISYNKFKNLILNYNAIGNKNETVKMYHLNTSSNFNNTNNTDYFDMVDMLTLDSFDTINQIGRCDVIKIDVDGIEYDILQGCVMVMKRYQPIFIVETNNDQRIIDFFVGNNYAVLDMELKAFHMPAAFPPNIFCIPK